MDREISYRIATCDDGFVAEELESHITVYGKTVGEVLEKLFHEVSISSVDIA